MTVDPVGLVSPEFNICNVSQIISKICSLSKSRLFRDVFKAKQDWLGRHWFGMFLPFLCGKYELPTDWKAQEYIEGQTNIGLGGIVFRVYLHLCGGKCEFPSSGNHPRC